MKPGERTLVMVRKTVMLALISTVMTAGLMAFSRYELVILHQRLYFWPMYAAIARYQAGVMLGDLTGRAQADAKLAPAATAVPVLVYHGIRPKDEGENISIQKFTDHLIALKRAGWQTVSIQDYYDFMRHGKQLPAKSFVITFDDGRKDSYYPVDPLLATLGYHATMFVITRSSFNAVENKFYLNKTELSMMQDSGRWDLQPHAAYGHYLYSVDAKGTQGHFYDNKLWLGDQGRIETDQEFADRTLSDLRLAKEEMQNEMGSSGIAFAFPFNEFGGASLNYPGSEAALMANVKATYPIAFYQIWPNKGNSQNYPQDPSFLMKRILIDSSLDAPKLLSVLTTSSAKALPYTSDMSRSTEDWLSTWGEDHWDAGGLTMNASPNGTGSAIFVDGGGAWRNYLVNAQVKLRVGQWVRVLGRFHDDRNYVSCSYSHNNVMMEEVIDGVTHDLGDAYVPVPAGDFRAELGVNGNRLECKVNGQTVTYDDGLAPELDFGSAGFAAYDPVKHLSRVQISDVHIDPLN